MKKQIIYQMLIASWLLLCGGVAVYLIKIWVYQQCYALQDLKWLIGGYAFCLFSSFSSVYYKTHF